MEFSTLVFSITVKSLHNAFTHHKKSINVTINAHVDKTILKNNDQKNKTLNKEKKTG